MSAKGPPFFVKVKNHKDADTVEDMLKRKHKPQQGYGLSKAPTVIIKENADDLYSRLKLIVAELQAGNDSQFLRNEARTIIDYMLEQGWMRKDAHEDFVYLLD